jgi:transcriptional regulator with XRE-family HTH domain
MTMVDPLAVGRRIRTARERRGFNRNQLARELGTSWQLVDRWEKGRTAPSPTSLRRLAETLEVSVDFILAGAHAPQSDGPGLAAFLAKDAPPDLSGLEEAWLRGAPVEGDPLTPDDYADLVAILRRRRSLEGVSARGDARPHARSGRHRKVSREAILGRLENSERDGQTNG